MKAFRRTKIVATIGPASQDPDTIRSLIKAGVNVFRLNFSHGDQNSHLEIIKHIKKIRENLAQPIAILQDLAGPKIRLGQIACEPKSRIKIRSMQTCSLQMQNRGAHTCPRSSPSTHGWVGLQ